MIKFKDFTLKFFYSPEGDGERKTTCIVEKSHLGIFTREMKTEVVGKGIATCSVNDNFCREKGRKLAMLRAMINAGISKENRREVWETYRNLKSGGRW